MNPFNLGMMALSGFNNPEAFASAMAAGGISPSGVAPGVPASLQGDPLAGFFTPSMNEGSPAAIPEVPGVMPGAAPAAGAIDPAKLLQGFKAPVQDNKPIMNAGVSGAQKAPEMNASALARGPAASNAILQAILGSGAGKDPLRVPSLGSLLGGM